ncbi:nicotinamidase-related amidase [Bacillus sp. SORGH_AS 510]|uniref:cysteine hydrolase family protein n=1 Tax=Bacillus sp. SORGH_AS_0510 TaxID=3041771 RepID=UPI00278B9C35|nr:cysteine hydrolase family protein [Bacillus sp. SORGH_AS_0510]MDQ1145713.1 nicotinamidase-related amidase [Bacillus sp. SORGH_AS_0510]
MKTFLNPAALLVLDVQVGFDHPYWGKRNNMHAEDNILKLLTEWRKRKWPVIYSQHLSLLPGSPLHYKNKSGTQFKTKIRPIAGEKVFQKNVNSAFIGTQLETFLHDQQIKSIVITGLSTQHCVSTTTRMSGNLGFDTYLIEDAIAAFEITDHNGVKHSAEEIQEIELAALNKEFATIINADKLITLLNN